MKRTITLCLGIVLFFILIFFSSSLQAQTLNEGNLSEGSFPSPIALGDTIEFQATGQGTFPATDPSGTFASINNGEITQLGGSNFQYIASWGPGTDTVYCYKSSNNTYDTLVVTILGSVTGVYNVRENGSYCESSLPPNDGSEIWLAGSDSVVGTDTTYYELYKNDTATGEVIAGDGSTLSWGLRQHGVYTIYDTTNNQWMSGSATISVITTDEPDFTFFSDSVFCEGGTGVEIGMDSSELGVEYILYNSVSGQVTSLFGNGDSLSYGYFTNASGYYRVEATNGSCVEQINDTLQLIQKNAPDPQTLTGPTSFCEGSMAEFTLSGSEIGAQYDFIDGNTGAIDTSIMGDGGPLYFTTTDSGSYYVIGTDTATLCTTPMNDTISLTMYPSVDMTVTPDSTGFCVGDSVQLSASGADTYVWTPATGLSDDSISNPIASPTSTQNYTVIGNNTFGCPDTARVTVTVNAFPIANAGNDTSICRGDTMQLVAGAGYADYSWNPSSNVSNPNNRITNAFPTTTTTYTVTVTSAEGCSSTDEVTITVDSVPSPAVNDPSVCLGDSVMLTATGGDSYSWSNGATGSSILVSPADTSDFIVEASYINGCSAEDTATVSVLPLPSLTTSNDTSICPGGSAELSALATGGSGGYTYNWSTGQTGTSVSVSPSADQGYRVEVTDSRGCAASDSINVSISPLPDISISGLNDTYCNDVSRFEFSATPTAGSYTDPWNDTLIFQDKGGGLADFDPSQVSAEGTYSITYQAANSNGCTDDTTFDVTVHFVPDVALSGLPDTLCENAPLVTLTGNPQSSNGSFTGTAITDHGDGTADFNPSLAGPGEHTLTYQYSDTATGCTNSASKSVYIKTSPNRYSLNASTYYCEQTPGDSISLTGGEANTLYEVYKDGTSMVYDTLLAADGGFTFSEAFTQGTYTVFATAPNGCADTMLNSVTTYMRELPEDAQPLSGNDTVLLDGIGRYTVPPIANAADYDWMVPASAAIDSGNGSRSIRVDFTDVPAGDHTIGVYGTNSCGTGDTAFMNVHIQPLPANIDSIAGPDSICAGSENITYEAFPVLTSADSIEWTLPGGFTIVSGRGTQVIKVNADSTSASNGYITARGINASGAGVADSLYVTVNPIPEINSAIVTDILDCAVDSVLITGSSNTPGASYSWVGGGETVYNDSAYATQTGDYTFTVDAYGCTRDTTVTVNQNRVTPTVTINPPDTITCSSPQVSLEASTDAGSSEYIWYAGAGGNIVSGDSTAIATVNAPGTYTVEVTNTLNSCSNTTSVTVEGDSTAPAFVISDPLPVTCTRDTSVITATNVSDASYQWSGPGILSGQNDPSVTVTQAGDYSLTVTRDDNGCSLTKTKTVAQDTSSPNAVVLSKSGNITCANPQVTLEATTTTSNVTYDFYPLSGGNVVSISGNTALVDQPDQYAVTITKNSTGCTAEDTVSVEDDSDPVNVVVDVSSTEITCHEPYDTLSVESDITNRTIQWSASNGGNIVTGATSQTAIVNSAGDYRVEVTDTLTGCTGVEVVAINNNLNSPVIAGISLNPDSITCTRDVTLQASVSGYSTLSWSGPGNITPINADTVVVDAPGTYTLTATAANGCASTLSRVVPADTAQPNMVLTTNYPDITCKNGTDTLEVSSGTPNVTYQWNRISGSGNLTSPTSPNALVDGPGVYQILITGDNGCTTTGQVTIDTNFTKPTITGFETTPDSISCANEWVDLSGGSSTPNAELLWTTTGTGTILDPTSDAPRVDQAGIYTLTVTHPLTGCTSQQSVEVFTNFAVPDAVVDQNVGEITCVVDTVRLDGSASAGVNFKWTARNGSSFLPNDSVEQPYVTSDGWYVLTVEHPHSGCTDQDSVRVDAAQNVPYILMGYPGSDTLTCAQTTLTLDVDSVSVPDYWWTTSGGNIDSGDSTLNPVIDAPGIYTFHAVDSVTGCTNTKSVTIYENTTKPNVSFTSDTLTCRVDTVHIISRVEYATDITKVSYQWSAGAGGNIVPGDENLPNPRVTASATYNLILTDDVTGCQRTTSHFVARNNASPVINIDKNPETITCARTKVTLEENSGQTGVAYEWTTTGSGNISNRYTATPTVDAAGWYTLRITNTNTGCFVEDSVEVDTNFTIPSVFIDPVSEITCSNPEIQLSGGSSDSVSYAWTGPGLTGDPASPLTYVDEGGVYTLTVTDKFNGCKNDSSIMVVENNNPPSAPMVSDTSTCYGTPNVPVEAIGTNIRWYSSPGLASSDLIATGNTYTPTFSAPGDSVYYVTQTSANGCESPAASVIYTIHNLPSSPAGADEAICYGEPNPFMDAFPSNSNYAIHWYNNADSLLSVSDSYRPADTSVGTYQYGITQVDLNGCESAREDVFFTINELPAPPVVEDDLLSICYGASAESFVAYGNNVKWYNTIPPASPVAAGNVFTPNEVTAGTYTYYVTQSSSTTGCESDYTEVTYQIMSNPAQFDVLGGGTYCEGTGGLEISLSGSEGTVDYELRQDDNPFITNVAGTGAPLSFGDVTAEGTYTAYGTASNGCTAKMNGTVVIDMNPLPADAGTIVGDSLVCGGETINYSVPPIEDAQEYIWSLPSGATIVAGDNSNNIAVYYSDSAQDGLITVYGENSCGTGAVSTGHAITVNQLPDTAGAIIGPNQICQGSNGITFEVPEITNAINYEWTLPSGATITSGAGSRRIIVDFNESSTGGIINVRGVNSCGTGVSSSDHLLDVLAKPIIVTDNYKSVCSSADSLVVENPGGGETVQWRRIAGQGTIGDNTSFETEVTNLGRGVNQFEVSLSNGSCVAIDTVTIENNQRFVNAGADETLCADSTQLSGSMPDADVTGTWSVEQGSAVFANANAYNTDITNIGKGVNVLRWTLSKDGCASYDEVTIVNNEPTEAEAGISRDVCSDSIQLDANTTTAGEVGEWTMVNGFVDFHDVNDPQTTISNIAQGTNTLRWTISKNNCSSSDEVEIRNNQVEVEAGEDQIICTYKTTMNASSAPAGTSAYWEVARGSADIIDPNSPTTDVYLLLEDTTVLNWVVNKNGCLSYDSAVIINDSPSKANAGDDQVVYQPSTFLNATAPTKGTGEWTLLSGSADFADQADPKTEVTNLAYGVNRFQWIVSYNSCISIDTVIIDNQTTGGVTAGSDTIICQDFVQLNASEPVQGEGEWSVVTGSATFENKNDHQTIVRGLSRGDNTLRWTVVGNGVVSDDVVITNNAPTQANAGPDMTYCADSTQLAANNPAVGTGTWSIIGGAGTFEDSTLNNTMVRNLGSGNNTLRWTITNKNCKSEDDVVITNNTPTLANAGQDQTLCSDNAVLYGNSPAIGEGLWTLVSGSSSVTFQDQNVGNTVVENLGHGDNVLRWTITNGNCSSSDEVTITNDNPTEANAGRDQSICVDSFQLKANEATIGAGKWTVINGYGEFEDTAQHNTLVRSLGKGGNLLRWTITHNGCVSYDEVEVSNDLVEADAGFSQSICVDSTVLSANNPAPGTGYWSVVAGSAVFEDPNQSNTNVKGLDYQVTNILKWTIANESCVSSDTLTIDNNHPGIVYAGQDKEVCGGTITLKANPNYLGTGQWESLIGGGVISDPNAASTTVSDLGIGNNTFRWTVRRNGCMYSDEVTIYNNSPVEAYAGENDTICSDSYVLHGEEPPFGRGKWTVVAGSGEFENDTAFTTTVNNMAQGANTYKWTLYNGKCSTSDEVTVVVNKPDKPLAGPDKSICSDSTYLQGNYPSTGQTGFWEIVEGSAQFEDVNDPKTKVTGLNYGRNVLRWNIEKNGCLLFDEVTITNNSPTVAFAGDDMHVCGDETNLNALEPSIGTGEWSLVSGSATFEDKTSSSTLVTDLSFGPNTLRWRTSHNGCTSIDDVIIYNDLATAYAGEDQVVYESSTHLVGNTPSRGEGKWIILGGSGTFENPDSAQTLVQDLAPGVNSFRWTITNNSCVAYDEVSVTYYEMPKVDFSVDTDNGCPPLTVQFFNKSLNANSAFTWDFGDGNVSTHENPRHTFYEPGEYTVELSTVGPDGSTVTSDTTILVHDLPVADFDVSPYKVYIPEQHLQCYNMSIDGDRYLWEFGDDSTSTLESPMHVYQDTGTYTIRLHVWSQYNCYDSTSRADIVQVIESGKIKFPSGFTPNPNGPVGGRYNLNSRSNDVFHPIVRGIQEYHLEIYNRWGVMVFSSENVDVGWDGYFNGKLAQEGVYIYKVYGRYNNGRAFEQTGDFILIRK